jgi:hypothetical protein
MYLVKRLLSLTNCLYARVFVGVGAKDFPVEHKGCIGHSVSDPPGLKNLIPRKPGYRMLRVIHNFDLLIQGRNC